MLAEDAIAIAESDPASWAARNAVIDLHTSIPPHPLCLPNSARNALVLMRWPRLSVNMQTVQGRLECGSASGALGGRGGSRRCPPGDKRC